tara:strand:+ start:4516 stop:5007 length:492 start_codon:yes stop_codon:yes gene_type:complete
MTEKHDKINGVITYHKRTKSGMAVFYPKHDVTIKKDEKIILHTVPSRQDILKQYEKCPIVSYTVCDATVRTEDAVADALAARISDKEFSSSDKKIIKMTIDALQKIDDMNLEKKDVKKVKQEVLDSFTKLMAIGIAQKIYDKQLTEIKNKKAEELRRQYESRS